ncbi:angiotensin-converting enzyme 2-like [Tubulanus polymorphus]|uniref:angiotensin-converting enzyme 2-like n=1 Tax=Tubulanus polymorphus TaxID=672921 RepID=UPI003DA44EB1
MWFWLRHVAAITILNLLTAGYSGARKQKTVVTEDIARFLLAKFDGPYTELKHKLELAAFDYRTDLENDEKRTRLTKAEAKFAKFMGSFYPRFEDHDISALPESLRSQLKYLVPATGKSLSKSEEQTFAKLLKEYKELQIEIENIYHEARVCRNHRCSAVEGGFIDLIMEKSRDYDQLEWAWKSVRNQVGPKMRAKYIRMVQNTIERGQMKGYNPAERMIENEVGDGDGNFDEVAMKLWSEVEPLYKELHAFVRHKLLEKYPGKFRADGPIPAHIFGNMYAQQWIEIADLTWPHPEAPKPDITSSLISQNYTANKIFKVYESLFVSMGMAKMTDKFWKYSMLTKPTDGRSVECHGSAFDMFAKEKDDFRIKICTEINQDSFHGGAHEMGHIQYDMAFAIQPPLLRGGVNSAFHEAIADTSLLANTSPRRLNRVGLMADDIISNKEADLNALMRHALWDIPLLPWTLLIDSYRWGLFNGSTPVNRLNAKWWDLRLRFQGMIPPIPRNEHDFDAGSKYHVANFVNYFRYFLDSIMKFEFLKALCDIAEPDIELHRCDLTNSKKAGEAWLSMLKLGRSKPWRETKRILTGGDGNISVRPLMEYYEPLHNFLRNYNRKNKIAIGW